MGAQRKKIKTAVLKTKKAKTYFRKKAASVSHKKTARAEQKRTTRAASASSKRIMKSARATIKKTAKSARVKTKSFWQKNSSKALRAAAKTQSPISRYFLSSDIMRQKATSVAQSQQQAFEKKVEVTTALNTGLSGRQKRSRLSRFEVMKRNFMIMVRRLLSWFSVRSMSLNMTISGKRALAQLEDLYDLLILEAADDESLLRLKVAYGEACYYVTQASRGYHKKHSGRGRENYRPYFDRFVDSSSG